MDTLPPNFLTSGDMVHFPLKGEEKYGYLWEIIGSDAFVYLYEDQDKPDLANRLIKVRTKDLQGD